MRSRSVKVAAVEHPQSDTRLCADTDLITEPVDPTMPLRSGSLIVLMDERLTAIHRFFHAGLDGPTPSSRLQLSLFRIATDITPSFCPRLRREE